MAAPVSGGAANFARGQESAFMDVQLFFVVLLAAVALTILVKRFFGGRYGNLRPSMETTNAYLSAQVDPEVRYHLSGSDLYPGAIIGIGKEWTLESDLWKPLEIDRRRLGELIFNMKSQGMGSGVLPYGHEIFDDRGEKIGSLFSLPGQNVTIWIKGEKRVQISTPEPPSMQK
jgi:hypothetical protein